MLHLLYILAFTIIAFLAISNLIRSLINVSMDATRPPSRRKSSSSSNPRGSYRSSANLHPELLDDSGKPVNEPLLVMRSVSVDDARQQLDAIYNASPNPQQETEEET